MRLDTCASTDSRDGFACGVLAYYFHLYMSFRGSHLVTSFLK